jgi:hypothetical protein
MAWDCGKPTDRHDLVAIVVIEKENSQYVGAYDAKIEKVIYRYGEEDESFAESPLSKIVDGSRIVVLESKLEEKRVDDSMRRFRVIRTDSCMKTYKVGDRIRLFSREVHPNIFRSSSGWTKVLDEKP